MNKCKLCSKENSTLSGLSNHLTMKHNVYLLDYFIKFENFKIPKCIICENNAKPAKGLNFYKTCCSKECKSELCKMKTHSEETKKRLSEKRIKYIKENKSTYNWSFYGKETIPEKIFRETISKFNIKENIYQYYKPNNCSKNYEIDFAIPELNIGFEINGNQHYDKDGNFTQYHLNRKIELEKLGWKIIDIHYSLCFNTEAIERIIISSLIGDIYFIENLNKQVINFKNERKKEKERIKSEVNERKINKQIKIEEMKKVIINSGIDFSKFGWVEETSKILQITPQKVTGWMRKNMHDFWEENCYKRKSKNKTVY